MSHLKERLEKNCLNCGVEVKGRYCQNCGQENVEVKESFWHLLMHFIEDLTHFDGKIWLTLKYLLTKPAFLTKEYMRGKRGTYIHPIRMYIFISAVFFLVIFSGEQESKIELTNSASQKQKGEMGDKNKDSLNLHFGNDTINYKTILAYDAAQQLLPEAKKDGWLTRNIERRFILVNQKYKGDNNALFSSVVEKFKHYFSRMLYVSLPLFAFFLWLLYCRNKKYYFVDHLIFSIHLYCAFFIYLFIFKLINEGVALLTTSNTDNLGFLLLVGLPFYLYKSMRNQFQQTRSITILKFFILVCLTLFLMLVLMTIFFLLSLFNI
jgi:hypothetical protein